MNRDDLMRAMQETAAAKPVPVKVKPWGTVHVRLPTVSETEAQNDVDPTDGKKGTLALAAARVICDESGKRLFDPANANDIALLSAQPFALLRKILTVSGAIVEDDDAGGDPGKERAGTS